LTFIRPARPQLSLYKVSLPHKQASFDFYFSRRLFTFFFPARAAAIPHGVGVFYIFFLNFFFLPGRRRYPMG